MTSHPYYFSLGGLPPQSQLLTDRAVFTNAYAFIPKGTLTDITTSYLPFWNKTRLWVLARPLSGFSETFSHYIMSVDANGDKEFLNQVWIRLCIVCIYNDSVPIKH